MKPLASFLIITALLILPSIAHTSEFDPAVLETNFNNEFEVFKKKLSPENSLEDNLELVNRFKEYVEITYDMVVGNDQSWFSGSITDWRGALEEIPEEDFDRAGCFYYLARLKLRHHPTYENPPDYMFPDEDLYVREILRILCGWPTTGWTLGE